MTDIAPALLEEVQKVFTNYRNSDKLLGQLRFKIEDGKGNYEDVSNYAVRLGELLSQALKHRVSAKDLPDGKLYYNIAEKLLGPLLKENHELISYAARITQQSLNKAAGLGVKAVVPKLDQERLNELFNLAASYDSFEDAAWVLGEPVVTYSQSVVDDAIRENVEYHGKAGLHPTVTRIAESGCCKWCSGLAGKYDYPVDREVYRRHNRCRCLVLYDPGDGEKQDVHSKISYDSVRDARIARAQEIEREKEKLKNRTQQSRRLIGTKVNGVSIKSVGDHVFDRMDDRGISIEEIKEAIDHPLKIGEIKTDKLGRRSFEVVGEKTTVTINPDTGVITTTHKTHSKLAKKLKGGENNET